VLPGRAGQQCLGISATSAACTPTPGGGGKETTYRAVNMYPGEMQLTRMFACAHSTASDAARWRTAALAALYGLLKMVGCQR
jgi:hypothetical protein